jgi:hypothetical protein
MPYPCDQTWECPRADGRPRPGPLAGAGSILRASAPARRRWRFRCCCQMAAPVSACTPGMTATCRPRASPSCVVGIGLRDPTGLVVEPDQGPQNFQVQDETRTGPAAVRIIFATGKWGRVGLAIPSHRCGTHFTCCSCIDLAHRLFLIFFITDLFIVAHPFIFALEHVYRIRSSFSCHFHH